MVWSDNKPWNRKNRPWRKKLFGRKKISFKRLPKSVARKRTDWVSLYNDTGALGAANQGCRIRCIEFGGSNCDEASVRIAVLPAAAVQALYNDDVTIAKMRGFINMKPRFIVYNGCDASNWILRMQGEQWPCYFRAGLYKQELADIQGGIPPFVDPNIPEDWNDVYALKRWQHIWQPHGRSTVTWQQPTKIIGVCNTVEQQSYIVPASSSGNQPQYTVPEIETSCCVTNCTVGTGEGACNVEQLHFERESYSWYRMSLNRNRPIRLHENDDLSIFMNWALPRADQSCLDECFAVGDGTNPCAMEFSIQLDIQLQYG